jgi:hypothetical protein
MRVEESAVVFICNKSAELSEEAHFALFICEPPQYVPKSLSLSVVHSAREPKL